MAEIYWIQVIGNLCILFYIMLFSSILLFFIFIAAYSNMTINFDEDRERLAKAKTHAHRSVLIIVVSTIGIIFTPSQKQLYIIYGIGGTIDYLKSNDKAKQLPDKCIDALTRYVDSIEKDKKKEKDEKE